jgi:lambda family phage tail tape measure protein
LKEDQIKIDKTLSDIQTSINEITMNSDQKKIANIQKQTNEYIKLATEKRRAQLGTATTDAALAEDKILQDTIKGIKEKQEAVVVATKKEIEASGDWSNGWKAAFNQYKQDAQAGATFAKRLFDDATKGMEDAIVTFAKTGKLSFSDLMNTLAEDILRSQIRQLMANMFSSSGLTGGTAGGANMFSAFGKMLGFADGGTIPTNAPVLVGERGPEIISGAKGMNVTPNDKINSGNNTIHNVTYNINATDARSFQQMIAADPSFIYAVTLRGQNMIPGGV